MSGWPAYVSYDDSKAADREVLAIVRQSATAVGMPADAFGAVAAYAASPAAAPVPHRDVSVHVEQVPAILDVLTAAEQCRRRPRRANSDRSNH